MYQFWIEIEKRIGRETLGSNSDRGVFCFFRLFLAFVAADLYPKLIPTR